MSGFCHNGNGPSASRKRRNYLAVWVTIKFSRNILESRKSYLGCQTSKCHHHVGFDVLTAMTSESTAFRNMTPCNPVDHFIGELVPDHTASHSWRRYTPSVMGTMVRHRQWYRPLRNHQKVPTVYFQHTLNPRFNGLTGAKGCPLDLKSVKSRIS
jgi:hypothetical protein